MPSSGRSALPLAAIAVAMCREAWTGLPAFNEEGRSAVATTALPQRYSEASSVFGSILAARIPSDTLR